MWALGWLIRTCKSRPQASHYCLQKLILPANGSLSRLSKSPSVKASEIPKIKRREEYWSFLRCVQKQKGRAREAATTVYHTTASKSLRTAFTLLS